MHMAQLMPLPLTVSCFSKIQIGFTFLVPAHLGSPGKGPLNGCVCVCVTVFTERFRAAVSVNIGPCCPALLELYSCKCAYCCIIGRIDEPAACGIAHSETATTSHDTGPAQVTRRQSDIAVTDTSSDDVSTAPAHTYTHTHARLDPSLHGSEHTGSTGNET